MKGIKILAAGAALTMAVAMASSAQAQCIGNCGFGSANGDVTAPPLGNNYRYVSTDAGVVGVGSLNIGVEINGSKDTTAAFSANAGSALTFYFNYITSDGGGFTDYAWAQLLTGSDTVVATLFSARTVASGNVVPGFGLPPLLATLTPATSPIQKGSGDVDPINGEDGGPIWNKLRFSSGGCFNVGCGLTGWIKADYTIADAGTYKLAFGVTNYLDDAYQSGLAYTGLAVDGVPVPGIPEPATWAMLISGFGLVGAAARRRRSVAG